MTWELPLDAAVPFGFPSNQPHKKDPSKKTPPHDREGYLSGFNRIAVANQNSKTYTTNLLMLGMCAAKLALFVKLQSLYALSCYHLPRLLELDASVVPQARPANGHGPHFETLPSFCAGFQEGPQHGQQQSIRSTPKWSHVAFKYQPGFTCATSFSCPSIGSTCKLAHSPKQCGVSQPVRSGRKWASHDCTRLAGYHSSGSQWH